MNDILIPFEELAKALENILLKRGFTAKRAQRCAHLFAKADLDGVRSHGANRFLLFLDFIKKGLVDPAKEPIALSQLAMFERWDGQSGVGNLNADFAMNRAINLSREYGISCVTLQNTNHWMRGGNFGWQAVEEGCIGICFTNTIPNMPAWGGSEPKIGNNPLVIAIPRANGPVVLDMAFTQFAYGKLSIAKAKGEQMPYEAGFDTDGNLTKDPGAVIDNLLGLPIGLWKGSGLSMVLDLLAAVLSGGNASFEVGKSGHESAVSQVFLCFDPKKLELTDWIETKSDALIEDLKSSATFMDKSVRYPGENTLATRNVNLKTGVPISEKLWAELQNELDS
ncbi:3-dehydro-L-gulonate 2-dehydrogenase [Algoriphagus ratkowskyi]|uniref:3-dehydro-L-gulonate 2-dehydrogenase n=1 Tax=Algoriphagus ratkowskyi TaxID=57028 RepID=A0A2W7RS08_9BACT|nr:3-dehydro-L-gulonate 2-dehydrogenase [Algoriphagus ratkowskyi]PZX61320.1 3-dehydro-L-gulonate 2-dehydrogenase [Algoriphagus ratkowskyi]TXD79426.1 3-dehydro-L-gulonate 2-dehydrogenase [Algoriphagus ratkowskyi]